MPNLHHLKKRGIEEFTRMLVMFLYLWVIFGLFLLYQTEILHTKTFYEEQGFAFFNALVLAKVMLFAENLKLGRQYEIRPLIIPILVKAALFASVFMAFHVMEKLVSGWWSGLTVQQSMPRFGGGTWVGFLCFWGIMTTTLIPFFVVREIARELGEDRLWRLMFQRD